MTTPTNEAAATPGRARSRRTAEPPTRSDSIAMALGIVALIAALLALTIGVLSVAGVFGRSSGGAATASCQRLAWAALPRSGANDLPDGWSVQAPQFDASRVGAQLVGPATEDGSYSTAYVQVTCLGGEAGDALARTRVSVLEAGSTVEPLSAGDEGFRYDDPVGGSFGAYFRRGDLLAFIQVGLGAPDTDLDVAVKALSDGITRAQSPGGLDIANARIPTPGPAESFDPSASPLGSGDPLGTDDPGAAASPAAPELEALLPDAIDGQPLERSSYTGEDLFAVDDTTVGRAILAALAAQGRKSNDFLMAQAEDLSGELEALKMLWAIQVKGLKAEAFEPVILDTLLNVGTQGVKTASETIGGKKVTVITYGDQGATSYAYATADTLFIVSATDAKLAATVLGTLK